MSPSSLIVVVVAKPSVENPTLCAWLHPTSCTYRRAYHQKQVMKRKITRSLLEKPSINRTGAGKQHRS
jgi:hypothetical protein